MNDSPARDIHFDCDVFVLGGGPAGATVSALLAQRGWHVVVAEKDRHPRFHIGESLLPMNLPLLEQLGVKEKVEQIAMMKYGAEFTSPIHDYTVTFDFGQAWDKSYPYAYQVRRSEFDRILFEHCIARGAQAMQECRVTKVEFQAGAGARIQTRDANGAVRDWRAKFFVDASGRDTFLANQMGVKRKSRKHASAALYGHFTGARRLCGKEEGNISIFWFKHGWFWFIPLLDGTTSVGAVCWPYYMKGRQSDPTTFLMETIALCPALAERLRDAELTGPATATGNYSYQSEHMVGEDYVLLGDAFAFIDPVFSSGVFLAMNSAFLASDAIDARLRNPQQAAALMRNFDRQVRHGLRNFSWFIYRMTNPSMQNLFMSPRNTLRMDEALLSLLAGDLFRGTPIYRSLILFKGVYYLTSLFNLRRSVSAWWRRKTVILRPQADSRGANP